MPALLASSATITVAPPSTTPYERALRAELAIGRCVAPPADPIASIRLSRAYLRASSSELAIAELEGLCIRAAQIPNRDEARSFGDAIRVLATSWWRLRLEGVGPCSWPDPDPDTRKAE